MFNASIIIPASYDLHVVNAARVSFDKQSYEFTYRKNKPTGSDEGLMNYLAKHEHWTPFAHIRFTFACHQELNTEDKFINLEELSIEERAALVFKVEDHFVKVRTSAYGWANLIKNNKINPKAVSFIKAKLSELAPETFKALGINAETASSDEVTAFSKLTVRYVPEKEETDPAFIDVTMRETVPIFVARQRFKHVVGFVYNEVSRRYVNDAPAFYIPSQWRKRPEGSVKQGSSSETVELLSKSINGNQSIYDAYISLLQHANTLYDTMIESEVAPEMARMVLPQSMFTSYFVTGSLKAWERAYKQRIDSHAQAEIQELAKMWNRELKQSSHAELWSALIA